MQNHKNCHRHLWLLSGTGEGPEIAKAFLDRGWHVTVSVVSIKASDPYERMPLENLLTGALDGVNSIKKLLKDAEIAHGGFELVVDATHPFATLITSQLAHACRDCSQPLFRYERPYEDSSGAFMLKNLQDLSERNLQGENLLLAIGSRSLANAIKISKDSGANIFARVLANPVSLRKALASDLAEDHIALLNPSKGTPPGIIEAALCQKWSIDWVLYRQSGGPSERLWNHVCKKKRLNRLLISRPPTQKGIEVFHSFKSLLHRSNTI